MNIFARSMKELGKTNLYEHKIDTGSTKSVKLRPYRTSPAAKQEIKDKLMKCLSMIL